MTLRFIKQTLIHGAFIRMSYVINYTIFGLFAHSYLNRLLRKLSSYKKCQPDLGLPVFHNIIEFVVGNIIEIGIRTSNI